MATILGTLHKDLGRFLLLTAVKNVYYLNKNAKETHSYVSITTLDNVKILTNTYIYLKMQAEGIAVFPLQQCLREVLQYYLIRDLPALF